MKIKRALSFYKHCNSGLIAVKYYHKNTESNRKNCDLYVKAFKRGVLCT